MSLLLNDLVVSASLQLRRTMIQLASKVLEIPEDSISSERGLTLCFLIKSATDCKPIMEKIDVLARIAQIKSAVSAHNEGVRDLAWVNMQFPCHVLGQVVDKEAAPEGLSLIGSLLVLPPDTELDAERRLKEISRYIELIGPTIHAIKCLAFTLDAVWSIGIYTVPKGSTGHAVVPPNLNTVRH